MRPLSLQFREHTKRLREEMVLQGRFDRVPLEYAYGGPQQRGGGGDSKGGFGEVAWEEGCRDAPCRLYHHMHNIDSLAVTLPFKVSIRLKYI